MRVRLRNDVGMIKECKAGFSWTLFFFGVFVPLLRNDFKWAGIMALSGMLTCGLSWLVFPFFYNKKYIQELLENGYTPATDEDRTILVNKGIINSVY